MFGANLLLPGSQGPKTLTTTKGKEVYADLFFFLSFSFDGVVVLIGAANGEEDK